MRRVRIRSWTFRSARFQVGTRAEEDLIGASRAYLVDYPAESLINWSLDSRGNFDWVVLRTEYLRKSGPDAPSFEKETLVAILRSHDLPCVSQGRRDGTRRSN